MSQDTSSEKCTVLVTPRDRFSVTEGCLNHLFKNTSEPIDVIVVMGGAPEKVRTKLQKKFGSKAKFIFEPDFLNTAQARNMGLRLSKTRITVCFDTDVYVRPGWLAPMLKCQQETNASLVTPIVLAPNNSIHTAGNDLFVTYENGKAYGAMELRFAHQRVCESTNIKRQTIDFAEVHCHLLVTEDALKYGIYDEKYREGSDMDSGMTLQKHGKVQMVEPGSMVTLHYPEKVDNAMDVRLYLWKWNIRAIKESYAYFNSKWNVDVSGRNRFMRYAALLNNRVGFWTHIYPASVTVFVDMLLYRVNKIITRSFSNLLMRIQAGRN